MSRTRLARARSRRQKSFPVLLESLESRLVPGTVLSVAGELLASLAWGRLGGHEPAGSAQPVPPPPIVTSVTAAETPTPRSGRTRPCCPAAKPPVP